MTPPRSNLPILLLGKFMSVFASSLFTFVAGLLVLTTSQSGLQFALVLLAGTLPRILLSPLAGALADRFNRKRIIINMEMANAVFFLVAGLLSLVWTLDLVAYLIMTCLLSAVSTFLSVTLNSSIPHLFEQVALQRVNSLSQTIVSFSSIGTPLLAGALFLVFPISLFLFLSSALFLCAALVASRLQFKSHVTSTTSRSTWQDIQSGFHYLRTQRVLWTLTLLAAGLNFFFVASEVLFPIVALQKVGASPFQFGLLQSMFAIGFVIASLLHALPFFTIRHRLHTIRVALFGMSLLFVAPAIPVYFEFSLLPALFFLSLFALTSSFLVIRANIPLQVHMQTTTDPSQLGRVMGVLESLAGGVTPLGFIIFGLLSDVVNPAVLYVICTVCLFGLTTISMNRIRDEIRQEKSEPCPSSQVS